MRKNIVYVTALSAALSLGLAAAQDTTTPATTTPSTTTPATTTTTTTQVQSFQDVPAGHWAKDAVDFITQRGLIQGFPDGTFRGNENLTRYQAALIFYRLLQTGALTNGSLSSTDVATITRGMQDVSAELAAVSSRVSDLERLTSDQQAQITALQNQIQALPTTGGTDTTARLDALEAKVNALPTDIASAADLTALTARVTTLEGNPAGASTADLQALTARVAALEAAQSAAPTTTTTTTPVTPGDTTTVVVGEPAAPVVTPDKNFYVGLNATYPFSGNSSFGYGAVIGLNNLFGGFGLRGDFDYQPGNSAFGGSANLTYNLGSGTGLSPYAGVGGGLVSSTARADANTSATDYFADAFVGVDYRFTDSLGVFAEANGKYFFSNNGAGTNLDAASTGGLGFGVKGGLKVFF